MNIRGSLVLAFLLTFGSIQAQTDFKPGFIIKQNGDTLTGEIDYRGDMLMGHICTFKTNDNIIVKYSPNDITGFRFKDSKYYVAKEVGGKNVFLEFLINGQVKVYYLRDRDGDHYYIEKEGIGLSELPYVEIVKYSEDKDKPNYSLYKSVNHIGILNIYMKDAPGFQARIANVKKPDRKNLINLTKDYQNIVCKDNACLIYEKKLPALQVDLDIIGSFVYFRDPAVYNNKNSFQPGILVRLGMPLTNEKLFLKSGVLFSNSNSDFEEETFYKIPIQIEYVYPIGIVRPTLGYGINIFNTSVNQTVSFIAGLNIKVYKSIHIELNYSVDFTPKYFLVPNSLYSQTISTGLLIKL